MPFISKKKYNNLFFKSKTWEKKARDLENEFYVKDYFAGCPSSQCTANNLVLKSEAKSFRKICSVGGSMFFMRTTETYYTTKENYKNHKPLIDQYEKDIKDSIKEISTPNHNYNIGVDLAVPQEAPKNKVGRPKKKTRGRPKKKK